MLCSGDLGGINTVVELNIFGEWMAWPGTGICLRGRAGVAVCEK